MSDQASADEAVRRSLRDVTNSPSPYDEEQFSNDTLNNSYVLETCSPALHQLKLQFSRKRAGLRKSHAMETRRDTCLVEDLLQAVDIFPLPGVEESSIGPLQLPREIFALPPSCTMTSTPACGVDGNGPAVGLRGMVLRRGALKASSVDSKTTDSLAPLPPATPMTKSSSTPSKQAARPTSPTTASRAAVVQEVCDQLQRQRFAGIPMVPKIRPTVPKPFTFNERVRLVPRRRLLGDEADDEQSSQGGKLKNDGAALLLPTFVPPSMSSISSSSTAISATPHIVHLTEPKPFNFKLDDRARKRRAFDEHLKAVEEEKRNRDEQLKREQETARRREMLHQRKLSVHRAQPIRRYVPLQIKKSEKLLTAPHSPNWHLRHK